MPPAPADKDFEALLRAFASVLELEQHALVHGQMDSIESLAKEKAAYVESLARAALAPASPESPTGKLLVQLRRLNEENGRLVAWRISHLRDRLSALSSAMGDGVTYDAEGMARARFSPASGARAYG